MILQELKFGEKTIVIMGNPLALFYYQQEFNKGLLQDMLDMAGGIEETKKNKAEAFDISKFNVIVILQFAWAMAKAVDPSKKFPKFERWLFELGDDFEFSEEIIGAVMEEASRGFFRHGKGIRGGVPK